VRHLLLVDDDSAFVALFQTLARRHIPDVLVLVAGTALDGFRLAQQHPAVPILIDQLLPDAHGSDLAGHLRALGGSRLVAAITASPDRMSDEECAVFDFVVSKSDLSRDTRSILKTIMLRAELQRVSITASGMLTPIAPAVPQVTQNPIDGLSDDPLLRAAHAEDRAERYKSAYLLSRDDCYALAVDVLGSAPPVPPLPVMPVYWARLAVQYAQQQTATAQRRIEWLQGEVERLQQGDR
jgi:CheY-like chemotaxis protein